MKEVKLTLSEMFSISRLVDIQQILGYKAALTKLYHEMLDNDKFNKVIELFEELRLNTVEISKKYENERIELVSEMKKSDSPQTGEVGKKIQEFQNKIRDEVDQKNQNIILEINKILSEDKEEFSYKMSDLLIKSIKNIIESEKNISEFNLEKAVVDSLMKVYIKISG
jgi:hypothetical protein